MLNVPHEQRDQRCVVIQYEVEIGLAPALVQPLLTAIPSLAGSVAAEQLARVYHTGLAEQAIEQQTVLRFEGETTEFYMTSFHQALRDEQGLGVGFLDLHEGRRLRWAGRVGERWYRVPPRPGRKRNDAAVPPRHTR